MDGKSSASDGPLGSEARGVDEPKCSDITHAKEEDKGSDITHTPLTATQWWTQPSGAAKPAAESSGEHTGEANV